MKVDDYFCPDLTPDDEITLQGYTGNPSKDKANWKMVTGYCEDMVNLTGVSNCSNKTEA